MTSTPVFYPLLLAALVLVCLIIHVWWPDPQKGTPSPMKPVKPNVSDPKNPNPSPDIFKSPCARPVSTAPIHLPRPLAPHRQRSSSPRADGVPWIRRDLSVPIPIAPIPAGSGSLTSAPTAIPVVNPGTSFNGGVVAGIVLRDPRHQLPWQTVFTRPHWTCHRLSGSGTRHSRHSARL